jgi:hypothetical protein
MSVIFGSKSVKGAPLAALIKFDSLSPTDGVGPDASQPLAHVYKTR